MKVDYDTVNKSVIMQFEIIDYYFGPVNENGYLSVCDFASSADGVNYSHLMRAETKDQKEDSWTWLNMRYKRDGAQIQFLDCIIPERGSFWPDNTDVRVEVGSILRRRGKNPTVLAINVMKWTPGPSEQDVKYIRIVGKWHVNGVYSADYINGEVYEIPKPIKPTNKAELNNDMKVSTQADSVVINGAELGENIKVFTTSGAEVKSVVTNNDEVKINLPKNQIYIVNIGQLRYKVAL